MQRTSAKYRLYGVLVHSGGSAHSGHYYCFVKCSNGAWYEMNDTFVRQVSVKTVLAQRAYMLFYARDPEAIAAANSAASSPVNAARPAPEAAELDKQAAWQIVERELAAPRPNLAAISSAAARQLGREPTPSEFKLLRACAKQQLRERLQRDAHMTQTSSAPDAAGSAAAAGTAAAPHTATAVPVLPAAAPSAPSHAAPSGAKPKRAAEVVSRCA